MRPPAMTFRSHFKFKPHCIIVVALAMSLLCLAALALASVACNARKRSFRMYLLLVTHGLLLGPAFSGLLFLLLRPTLFLALFCACSFLHVSITCILRCLERIPPQDIKGLHKALRGIEGPYIALKGLIYGSPAPYGAFKVRLRT